MDIQQWLESDKNYKEGIVLLSKYSKNKILIRSLSKSRKQSKLVYELKKIHQRKQSNVVKEKTSAPKIKKINPDKHLIDQSIAFHTNKKRLVDYPVELHDIYKMAVKLHYDWLSLKIELVELPAAKVKEALYIQRQMYYLKKENQRCWDKLNYYSETNEILVDHEVFSVESLSSNEKTKTLFNLRSSYSKRKKTIEKWMEVGENPTKIMKKRNELKLIKTKIKILEKETK